jgi:hypothetical protein
VAYDCRQHSRALAKITSAANGSGTQVRKDGGDQRAVEVEPLPRAEDIISPRIYSLPVDTRASAVVRMTDILRHLHRSAFA